MCFFYLFACLVQILLNCNERCYATQHDWTIEAYEKNWFKCIKYQWNVHQHIKCTKSLHSPFHNLWLLLFSFTIIKHCSRKCENVEQTIFLIEKWNVFSIWTMWNPLCIVTTINIFFGLIVSLNKQKLSSLNSCILFDFFSSFVSFDTLVWSNFHFVFITRNEWHTKKNFIHLLWLSFRLSCSSIMWKIRDWTFIIEGEP